MSTEFDSGVRIADKYEIIGPLGRGAYGSVYRAIQHPVERTVALKVISPHAATDESLRARFFREARAIARLNHPGVVTLHDYGDSAGTLYMVMEYVDGRELKQVVKDEAPLDPIRALDYIRQVVTVLVEAHGLDLIHRDLKPANIMIVQDAAGEERIKILDFGIAKLLDDRRARFQTQMGTVVGSPSYFSPEQAMGEPCGPAADQYSVAVILYEMLTGRKPFVGSSLMALINAHRFDTMPPLPAELGLPKTVAAFLRRAMEKQPADRFPDARAMLDALDLIMRQLTGTDRPSGQRPAVDSYPVGPSAAAGRRPKITAPLPGLEADEELQSGEQLATHAETVPDPIPGLRDPGAGGSDPPRGPSPPPAGGPPIDRTAALIALGSAHELYNSAADVPARSPSAEPRRDDRPTLVDDEPAALPGVEAFNASSTLIRPPPPKAPRSPLQIALVVGGIIAVLGILGMWLLSRGRQAPVEADAAIEADAVPEPDALVEPGAAPPAAPVDAAPGPDATDGAASDGAASDGAASDGADGGGASDAAAAPPRRRAPRRPRSGQTPYQKL